MKSKYREEVEWKKVIRELKKILTIKKKCIKRKKKIIGEGESVKILNFFNLIKTRLSRSLIINFLKFYK